MSIVIEWKGGDDVVTISSDSRIGFFGMTFGDSIVLNAYQETTHVTNDTGTVNDGELPNLLHTVTAPGSCKIGNRFGSGSAITDITSEQCTLHLSITNGEHSRLQAVKLIAYSGSLTIDHEGNITASGPSDATVVGFELGNVNWTVMNGSTAPLMLTPYSGAAGQVTHNYYIGLSAAPQVTGINPNISLALYAEWY